MGLTGCWTHDQVNQYGYGRAHHKGRTVTVHRAVYEELVGPIPEGLQLDHLCRNRACYNPAHLEPVTQTENIRRGFAARGAALTEHGRSMYANRGCRCDVCTAGWRNYWREYRRKRDG